MSADRVRRLFDVRTLSASATRDISQLCAYLRETADNSKDATLGRDLICITR